MLSTLNARRARAAGWSASRFTLLVLLVLTSITVSSLAFPQISAGQAWTATWTPKTAAPVGPRGWVDGAYDSAQGRVMIFGGGADSGIGDVWQYDTSNDQWVQLQTAPSCASGAAQPPAEYASAYDPVNQLLWMFGGSSVGCGGLSLVADAKTTSTVIVDRTLSATTPDFYKNWVVNIGDSIAFVTGYDPAPAGNRLTLAPPLSQAAKKGRYVLYAERGGLSGFAPATKTFTNVTGTTPEPTNRMSPALAYSTKDRALVMFGGQGGADTWAFDVNGKRWTQMTSSPGAATPPGLSQLASSMVYDGDDDVFVLFGGCLCTLDLGASSGDTWTYRLSSNTWTKVTPAVSPPARQGHHLVYDSANKRVILFGGFDATSGTYFNDVWIYSVTANTWSMVLPAVSPPARRMAAMVYDPVQQRTVLFGGQGPEALADVWVLQLQQSASGSSTPTLTSLSPSPVTAGSPGFTLTVTGANFASTSVVQWNGSNRTTTFVRGTQLQASIAAADIASAGSALVSASTPGSGGGTSNSLTLAIAAPTPAPILSSISPTTASAGGAAFTLTATGSNFTSGSIVQVNGASRTTTFVSSTQLTAAIPASDIAAAGTPSITVFTPAPGGGTSGARSLTVASVNPTPTITSLSPASVTAGSAAFTLTVTGTGFAAGATATVGGQARTVTVGSATQVSIAVQATDVASQGTLAVVVTNPASCTNTVCASNSVNFTVAASSTSSTPTPAPILSSIGPTTTLAGGAAFTLTATGSNFTSGSIVQVNGASRTTTFVSSTQLTAAIPASDIAAAGTPSITVFTPAPGGGTSGARSLTVASVNSTPTITSLSPASVTAGSAAFTLTVTGTGFAAGATATVGGQARTVTVDSATQMGIAVQATDVASQGTLAVVVTNPASCTNTVCASNSVNLTVAAPSTSSTPTSPVLYFTDLTSGPRSGNGDTSKGQIANQDGALVTVWGQNLGTSQGTSTITLGGVTPTAIYYWGNATSPNCGPATLYNKYQKLQCVIFQVAGSTPTGLRQIVVTTANGPTNSLPFTVTTTGAIKYAAVGGGGAGTFSSPYSSIQTGINALDRGDVLYVRDGLNALGGATPGANSRYDHGDIFIPITVVTYPGATSQIGDATHTGFPITLSGTGYGMTYAKFKVYGDNQASGSGGQAMTLPDYSRAVGNWVTAPLASAASGGIGAFGNYPAILGNEMTQVGKTGVSGLYHVIYVYGRRWAGPGYVESHREIGWNYIHDNYANRAINIWNDQGPSVNNAIADHNVHDNVIVNQDGDGIFLGQGVVGTNYVTNNVLINVGTAAGLADSVSFVGFDLRLRYPSNPAWTGPTAPISVTVTNNTLLNAGNPIHPTDSGGFWFSQIAGVTMVIKNNLIDQATGHSYVTSNTTGQSGKPTGPNAALYANNLWSGAGAAPTWDSDAVNANPLLVSDVAPYDLHLQAGSPAIGAGVDLGGTSYDVDGRLRPSGSAWDIGAYQASGSGTAGQASTPSGTGATTTTDSGTSGQSTTPTTTSTTSTGTTASSTPPPSLTLTYNGMLRDAVGQSNTAAGPDGALDEVMTVTVYASGGRTVTGVRLASDGPGTWDTDSGTLFWVLGVAPTAGGALLNAPATMAVNFPVADGGSFVAFASDSQGIEFLPGRTLTLTATFSDGTTATATTTVSGVSTSSLAAATTSPEPTLASASVAEAPVSLPPVGTWAALPGTALAPVIWRDAQGRTVNELKGASSAWYSILNAWNGAGYRYDTDTMIFPALGGHQDGADNSVYSVNVRTGTASRDFDATVDIIPNVWEIPAKAFPRYVDSNGEYGSPGLAYPASTHRYDGMVHIEGTDYLWVGGGPAWGPGTSTSDVFLWDTTNKKWTWMNQDPLLAYESIIAATYDPIGKRVLYMDTYGIVEWVLNRPAGQRARRILLFPRGQDTSNRFQTLLVDVKRNRLVAAGVTNATTGASQIRYWDLTTLQQGVLTPSTGAFSAWSLTSPGFDIDVDNDRYLIYSGGDTLTWLNPATGAITLEQTAGAPAVINTNGTWGRMRYSRNLKAVLFTQDMFAGTWVYQVRQP